MYMLYRIFPQRCATESPVKSIGNRKWLHGLVKVSGKVAGVTSNSPNDPYNMRTEARAFLSRPTAAPASTNDLHV